MIHSAGFEEREGLVVAGAVEIVREPRVDRRREQALKFGNLLGNRAETIQMAGRVAGIPFAIGDHGDSFAQGVSEGLLDGGVRWH